MKNDLVDIEKILAAFGKATMRCLQQEERIERLERDVDKLRLDLHHAQIRAQALCDERNQLKEKAETALINQDDTDYQLQAIEVEDPTIVRPFQ